MSLFLTRDVPLGPTLTLAAGLAAGGFLIDVDHAVDYVLFERDRRLTPSAFLRHYLEGRVKRVVLVLHSYEVFALLGLLAWRLDTFALWGYLMGGLMHLALDIVFNGKLVPRSIIPFYSFTYRLAYRFDAVAMSGLRGQRFTTSKRFWTAFFVGPEPIAPSSSSHPALRTLRPDRSEPVG
jgi:hypothetical protein